MRLERAAGWGLAAAGLLAIAVFTLTPDPGEVAAAAATPLLCLICGNRGGVDVLQNLLLFVPLGAGLRLAGWRWRRIVAVAALVSFTVEFLQFTVVAGRDASLSDLLTNTTGAAIAAALIPRWRRVVSPNARAARLWFAGWTILWIGVLVATVWLQDPRTLRGPIRNRWPEAVVPERSFAGTLLEARVNGVAMPRGDVPPDRAALRRSLDRGEVLLEVRAVSGPPTEDLSLVYGLLVRRIAVLGLGQYGRDAVLIVPSRAQRFRLWATTLQLPDAFPPDSGVPMTARGELRDGRLRLSVSWGAQVQQATMLLRPTLGWAVVAPLKFVLGRKVGLLTALWVGALVFPLGFWAAGWRRPGAAIGALGVVIGAGLLGVPAIAGTPPTAWSEWTAAVVAAAIGWAGSRFAKYLQLRCGSPSISGSSSS
jgi:hypothetical protein